MSFWDWVYRYFEGLGKYILRMYPNLSSDIRRSGMHLYPEVYASFMAFMSILISGVTVVLTILFAAMKMYIIIPFLVPIPFLAYIFLAYLPALIGSSRAGGIEGEFPYTTAYLSMMVMSGLSPYVAFERITHASKVFTKTAELSQRFILLVRVLGRDPLTAFSMLAQRTPSPTARDLLMGYVTTVRAGGDVADYLNKKARLLFSELIVRMKIIADRLAGLLEAYLALVLLSLISLAVMYFVTVSFVSAVPFGLSPASLFLVLYILIPMISGMIIYLTDVTQYKEPWIDYRPYIMFGGLTLPLSFFLVFFGMLFPAILPPGHPFRSNILVSETYDFLVYPAKIFNLPAYTYSSVALSMILIIATLPTTIYTEIISREYKVITGITRFLRDLVEIRKTGLSPERSIIELSRRNYGVFTKYLRKIALQLSLGIPLSRIIQELFKKIIVWRAKVLLFVLTDTIEVGGGSVEIMEHLAWFAESVDAIEDEKKKNLRTLLIVPYMGGILTAATVIMLAVFMGSLQFGAGGSYIQAASTTLPAIVINTYLMGLVAGKVSSGSVAAGFKHAILLTFFTLIFFLASPLLTTMLGGVTQPVT
ncbi:type II secretion system F family protein [Staphylothermus hellenicus]|uniref:Type II secretion system F domain protein n=1 Tax=Staphylothermus hellenicus (strain DSM 12710 / JCM 10830 / BK20S6-10-b1 / P8) TaxID=591019 RepID=D7D8I7_STAHD|nr:type II secretion system F family protein [Staphylothermus hellenicus]ADI32083.1 Type II secretion system F domain protein [Staphylothermus hellenicus DSM 12710]